MATTLSLEEAARRVRLLRRSVSREVISPREQTGFWFDPEYSEFLEDVRRKTPSNATIAVIAPPWPDVYVYQAAYQLAPRRVVLKNRAREASYVAEYRTQIRNPADPKVIAVTSGSLTRQ